MLRWSNVCDCVHTSKMDTCLLTNINLHLLTYIQIDLIDFLFPHSSFLSFKKKQQYLLTQIIKWILYNDQNEKEGHWVLRHYTHKPIEKQQCFILSLNCKIILISHTFYHLVNLIRGVGACLIDLFLWGFVLVAIPFTRSR